MTDAAVEFLLQNLQQVLTHHIKLIKGAESDVERLEKDLRLLKSFLRDSTKIRMKDDKLQEVVRQIRDVVYDAEDVIDAFITQAGDSKSKNYFIRAFTKPVDLHRIGEVASSVSRNVQDILGGRSRIDLATLDVGGGGEPAKSEAPQIRKVNVVGFEDEAAKLIGHLKQETNQLDVISIIGMPGLGKTTLAGMIFRDPEIQFKFPILIWVYVSSVLTRKKVFLDILKGITRLTDDMQNKDDEELALLVADQLERTTNFLIVMDDVWTTEDWDKLKIALPSKGKILITSRDGEVARYANRNRDPHNLRFLTYGESWLLLRLEVFGKSECPEELEVHGKEIVEQCDCLPLAIVVIGGILAKKYPASAGISVMEYEWEKVSKSVRHHLNQDPGNRMEKIISLSYNKLPYYLRACFLYLGMFPEDYEIPVWKLIRMWIGEGFIQQNNDVSLEETAENYLKNLINRNLVRVDKMSPNGSVKTCRIHDMLRDFCINESANERENFLQEVKKSSEGGFVSDIQRSRRLCIHSNVLGFISSKPYGPRVRSFVCFSKDEINLQKESFSVIPTAFKLLRVLDAEPLKFTKITADLYQLVHLRYIHLFLNLDKLPSAFSKLWNIQTLIIDTPSRTLEIKADIWEMIHLRHLKTKASATLPKPGKSSKGGNQKLQTLGTISPQSCTEEVLDKARNLKKLGIRGKLAKFLEGKIGSFDCLVKLDNLEKLKLINDVFPYASSDNPVRVFPPAYKFPLKLRSLTLSETFLNWNDHMDTLGMLENLKVLKLREKAFMGKSWKATDRGFRRLEVLHIGLTNLAIWVASNHHFPRLIRLELHYCGELQEIPIGFAGIETLESLNLYHSKFAAASAKKIRDAIQKKQKEKSAQVMSGFKLSIFPSDE